MTAGTRVGPYELLSLLGSGGMGEVYRARDTRLHRIVAVKMLPAGVATAARLHRFEQEARAASALSHPNILTVHDVGREGDAAWIAMEWVEGQTLRSVMDGPRVPLRRVAGLAAQIADGLAKAHAAGIVHRDIKPENVMVSDDGFVKIVDFGLATLAADASRGEADHDGRVQTQTGSILGTVGYLSPEQASGHAVDYRSDQFALGLLIYEMATRVRPFDRPSVAQSLAATIESEPDAIETLNDQVSPHLAAVVKRCLEKAPADRYESTRDLARELKRVVDEPTARRTAPLPRRAVGRWALVVATAAVVLMASVASMRWRSTNSLPISAESPLVAMRPFHNLSNDASQADFAAGLSDEIHAKLSTLGGLRLLSGSAVGRNAGVDNARLATEFGVDHVLEGAVRVDGQRVEIEARVVDAQGQRTIWSAGYDRERAEALAIPGEVTLAATKALGVTVTADEQVRVERPQTRNLDAYLRYLHWRRIQGDWNDRASHYASLEPLRQAIALDPAFAGAHARLAYELAIFGDLYDDAEAFVAEGVAHAEAALRHDPASAEAHGAIAVVHLTRGQSGLARLSFQRAIALDPNDTSGMNNLSILDVNFGRFATGLEWARRAFERSSRRGNDYYHVSAALSSLRDDDLSLRWLLDGERRYPASPRVQQELAYVELLAGRTADALARARRAVEKGPPDNPEGVMALAEIAYLADAPDLEALTEPLMKESASAASVWLGETVRVRYAYALARRGEVRLVPVLLDVGEDVARRRIDSGDESPRRRLELAAIAALRRGNEDALDWLSRAYDAGYRDYGVLERDPAFSALRSHSRFLAVLDAMRRDISAQRQAAYEKGLLDIDALLRPPSADARQ